ncbi:MULTISPECIES: DsbA family oxidoreductase [unclassified Nocardiopsis]|uniref:DsbA family oxidoreductase n=1 Tax=unclassified Nocardiopsis TaxID=2649073 RepID=UPI00135B3A7D|nr:MULTISPECIES: DsbA family oxidoreductase [unclassified Nocardiopsis]
MQVEVWFDVVCPWCYIGKRRLERALERFGHAEGVRVLWRGFQLDPAFPQGRSQPVYDALARKMGATREQVRAMTEQVMRVAAQEGLEYDFANGVMINTFDVHRVLRLAGERGLGGRAHEAFLRAQLVEARDLSRAEAVVEVAVGAGLEAGQVRAVLEGDGYAQDVREDMATAQQLGVSGVPFFVLDRSFGLSGAQPVEVLVSALEKAHQGARG